MIYINNNKIKCFGGIKRAYLNNTLIFQSFKKNEEVISPYDITSKFNVTSTTSQTQLCYSSATSSFTEMYVDGVQIDVASGYTFNTIGEHTVQYMLADKTKIVDYAFRECSCLASIVILDSVETIGDGAFYSCSSLSSIDFGKGVKTIGNIVFYWCSNLTKIVIPENVIRIGNLTFNTCYFHKDNFINNSSATGYPWSATIYDTVQDDGLYILGTTAVGCKTEATNITIPDTITNIGNEAFLGCSRLTEITCLATTAPKLGVNSFMNMPESGTLTYPCESDYSAWLEQLRWKDTCNQGGQEGWETLTKDTNRRIQMQTFRIDTSPTPTPEFGEYFITFSTEPDYPGENADLTYFSICPDEDTIYDNHSRKNIRDQKHIEGNVYEYTFSVPVYFAGGERNAPLSQVQYKTTSGDTPGEVVSPYDITAKFDADIKPFSTQLCFSRYTSAFTEMYVDDEQKSPTSAYTFNTTGEHTVGYMLKDKTKLDGSMSNGHFKGCSRMTEIKFKDALTSISGPAFSGCTSLQKVTFGSGLTSVGTSSGLIMCSIFTGCTNLREITCLAPTAPTLLKKSIQGVENNNGVLYVPYGSDYRSWTSILKNWTIQYLT